MAFLSRRDRKNSSQNLETEVLRTAVWRALENSPAPRVLFDRRTNGSYSVPLKSFIDLLVRDLKIAESGDWGETTEIAAEVITGIKGVEKLDEGISCDEWLLWLGTKPEGFTLNKHMTQKGEVLRRATTIGNKTRRRGSKFLAKEFALQEMRDTPVDLGSFDEKAFDEKAKQLSAIGINAMHVSIGETVSLRSHNEASFDVREEATQKFAKQFIDILKAGWPVDKVTSKGKFVSRKINLSEDEAVLSWPSRMSTASHSIHIRDITGITYGSYGKFEEQLGSGGDLSRAVSIQTSNESHEFRMRDDFDACNFVKGLAGMIQLKYAVPKSEEEEEVKSVDDEVSHTHGTEKLDEDHKDEGDSAKLPLNDHEENSHGSFRPEAERIEDDKEEKEQGNEQEDGQEQEEGQEEEVEEEKGEEGKKHTTDNVFEEIAKLETAAQIEEAPQNYEQLFEQAKDEMDYFQIVQLLTECVDNITAVIYGLNIISSLASNDSSAKIEFGRNGAHEAIVTVMHAYSEELRVLVLAMNTALNLVKRVRRGDSSYDAERFCATAGAQAVCNAMTLFSDRLEVQEVGCALILSLWSKYTEESLRLAEACECVTRSLKIHMYAANLQNMGFMAIARLVKNSAVNVRRVREINGGFTIITGMKHHIKVEKLQLNGVVCIAQLADISKDPLIINHLCRVGACEAVIESMNKYIHSPSVQRACSSAIAALSSDDDGRSKLQLSGACEALVKCVEAHASSAQVLILALDAVVSMTEDHNENRSAFRECNIGAALDQIRPAHLSDEPGKEVQICNKIAEIRKRVQLHYFWSWSALNCGFFPPTQASENNTDAAGCTLFPSRVPRSEAHQSEEQEGLSPLRAPTWDNYG